jgi:hypothetical protein
MKGDTAVKEHSTTQPSPSSSLWEHLEEFARDHVQRFIQGLVEEEVTEL